MLQAGEAVQVQGYWEEGEFKAARVIRLQDGQTVTLRDEVGRPAWAGSNGQAGEQPAADAPATQWTQGGQGQASGQGRGMGRQGSGQSQGGYGGGGLNPAPLTGGDLSESEVSALQMALEDEYKAWSVYEQVIIAGFGAVQPFASKHKTQPPVPQEPGAALFGAGCPQLQDLGMGSASPSAATRRTATWISSATRRLASVATSRDAWRESAPVLRRPP